MGITEFLDSLTHNLISQDNKATSDPLFCVYDNTKVFGFDPSYADEVTVLDRLDSDEVPSDILFYEAGKTIEEVFQSDLPSHMELIGYRYIPRFITACFTEEAAQDYITRNRHNLENPYVFVHSLGRNHEMINIRNIFFNTTNIAALKKFGV